MRVCIKVYNNGFGEQSQGQIKNNIIYSYIFSHKYWNLAITAIINNYIILQNHYHVKFNYDRIMVNNWRNDEYAFNVCKIYETCEYK